MVFVLQAILSSFDGFTSLLRMNFDHFNPTFATSISGISKPSLTVYLFSMSTDEHVPLKVLYELSQLPRFRQPH